MNDIFETLRETAARHPGSIALASRSSYMHFEDFVGNIASAARAAARNGIKAGDLVVLAGANADAQFIIALALLRLGCRVGYSRDVTLYQSSGVAVDAVIADRPVPGAKLRIVVIERDWFTGASGGGLSLPPPAAEYAMIYASSGSTGRPKLIEAGPRAVAHGVSSRIQEEHLQAFPRFLSAMGSRTAAHFCCSLAVLLHGGTVIGVTDRSPKTVLETIQVFKPDYVIMPPSTLVEVLRCFDEKPRSLEKVAYLRTSGSRCDPELQRAALDRIADEFISHYGSTETGGIAWGFFREVLAIEGCAGRVAGDVEVAAFGPDERRLPAGNEGEIRVKGPDGAFGRHIGTAAPQQQLFKDGWFVTGDIGFVDENRNLIIRGRATNVINVGGSKVSPELLEQEIRSFSQIRDVGVTGVERPEGFEEICAAIVSNTKLTVDDITALLRRRNVRWPVHMVKLVPSIPKTESGKIDRIALKRLCSEQG